MGDCIEEGRESAALVGYLDLWCWLMHGSIPFCLRERPPDDESLFYIYGMAKMLIEDNAEMERSRRRLLSKQVNWPIECKTTKRPS